jgi:spore coat polysaccharide biosynthesis predicted glycosyltransferase SpsG
LALTDQKFHHVLIRADGRKSLGMGHLSRAHILATAFVKNCGLKPCLLTRSSEEARLFLEKKHTNYDVVWLESEASISHEDRVLNDYIGRYNVKYIVTDLLENELTQSYLKFLRGFGKPVISILDMTEFYDLDVDLVINGNPNQSSFQYEGLAQHLSGPEFFIMDNKYSIYPNRIWRSETKNIMVCLGGTDHNNLIFKTLDALSYFDNVSVKIITSQATGYLDELRSFCLDRSINAEIRVDIESLYYEWSEVDFAITAGGNVLFERIASGTPGVTICQLPRQMEIADFFVSSGVNINLGYGLTLDVEQLKSHFYDLLESGLWKKKQIELCKSVVPGNGLGLSVSKIMQLGV